MMVKRVALGLLAAASPAILLTFFWSHPLAEVLFALLGVLFPVALMLLGASRKGGLGGSGAALAVLALLLAGCVVGMLALRGRVLEAPWVGGLPLAAALQIYGVWLAPLGLVALAFALTFHRFGVDDESLRRLSDMRHRKGP